MAAAPDISALAAGVAEIMLDLPSFGALVEIKTKNYGKIPFGWAQWHPEQRRFEKQRTGRDIILKPRQIGFSTLELLRDFQFARTHEGAQVVVVVHNGDSKNELFSAVHLMQRCLEARGLVPKPKENTKTGLRWDDLDSSIKVVEAGKDESTAAARGRSGTIHRLHATEVAFYAQPEETMTALLAATGENECVIESTANGIGNWFHERVMMAREGRFEDFRFHFFGWHEHPEYSAAGTYPAPLSKREQFWETELRKLGCTSRQIAWWRKQVQRYKLDKALREYPPTPEAAFTESGESWIAPEYLDRLRTAVREPIERLSLRRGDRDYGELRVYERPQERTAYIVCVDPSEGVGLNEAAMTVLEHRTGTVVACWHNDRVKPGELAHAVAQVGRWYNTALAVVERNAWRKGRDGSGDGEGGRETLQVLVRDERYPRVYREPKTDKLGWATTKQSRPLIFGDLLKGIEDGELTTPDARMVEEAASLIGTESGPRVPMKNKARGDDGLFITWGIGLPR